MEQNPTLGSGFLDRQGRITNFDGSPGRLDGFDGLLSGVVYQHVHA